MVSPGLSALPASILPRWWCVPEILSKILLNDGAWHPFVISAQQTVSQFSKTLSFCPSCRSRIASGMTDPASSYATRRKSSGFRVKPGMTIRQHLYFFQLRHGVAGGNPGIFELDSQHCRHGNRLHADVTIIL